MSAFQELPSACSTIPTIWHRDADHRAFRVLDHRAADADRLLRSAYLIDRKFRGHAFWTTDHPDPDDAVAGGGRQFLALPL